MISKCFIRICSPFSKQIRSPLDIKLLTQPTTLNNIKQSLAGRFRDPSIADQASEMLVIHRTKLFELEGINKEINLMQKEIKGRIKGLEKGQSVDEQILKELADKKERQKGKEGELKELSKEISEKIFQIGNILHPLCPIYPTEDSNQVISTYVPSHLSHLPSLPQISIPYSQICEKFSLTDLKRGQKVSGHRGYFLKGPAVSLALGLAQYGINFLQKYGYEIHQTPAIIVESALKGSCQLQSVEDDVYKLEGMSSYLIATSEQSLAAYYQEETLGGENLPIRMGGYSTCFRKEAGAHGKDIHGLFRVHQFEKVEQFVISNPEESHNEMNRMIKISEEFYKSLEIPYRVVNIVSGELNNAAAIKYDLEGWYPSQGRYRELVSVSNCTDYQARLLNINAFGSNFKYPHMLNGTLVAIQRAITCLVENGYEGEFIKVPKVLQNYVGMERIKIGCAKNEKGKN